MGPKKHTSFAEAIKALASLAAVIVLVLSFGNWVQKTGDKAEKALQGVDEIRQAQTKMATGKDMEELKARFDKLEEAILDSLKRKK